MAESIKIEGLDELSKLLDELSSITSKTFVKNTLKKAAKPIILTAKEKLRGNLVKGSRSTGKLAKSIGISYESENGKTIGIGPRKKTGSFIAGNEAKNLLGI